MIVSPPDSMHVGDTVVIHARALNRSGDTIQGAPLVLISLAPDTMSVDSARFAVVGLIAGVGRAVVKDGSLFSAPLLIPIH